MLTLLVTFSLSLSLSISGQTPAATSTPSFFNASSEPTPFLQEGISVPNQEAAPTFTPDGNTVYLGGNYSTILVSKKTEGSWSKPVPVSFAKEHYKDWDPTLTPDGKRLIFVSNRPWPGMDTSKHDSHLWYVDRLPGDRWSEPVHLPSPVNISGANDYGPSVSKAGTICFCSRNRDGDKGMSGYCALWAGDHYEKPQRLNVNGNSDVYDPFIAPDERYIIFASDSSIFISYRKAGGGWTTGEKLGPQVTGGGTYFGPSVSPDGKTLYFSSSKTDAILMIPVHIPE